MEVQSNRFLASSPRRIRYFQYSGRYEKYAREHPDEWHSTPDAVVAFNCGFHEHPEVHTAFFFPPCFLSKTFDVLLRQYVVQPSIYLGGGLRQATTPYPAERQKQHIGLQTSGPLVLVIELAFSYISRKMVSSE
jgi:hypothetical protein